MPITRRYTPEHPPGETCSFGLDYSFVIPPGIGIDSAALEIWTNTAAPIRADGDWIVSPVTVRGRVLYAQLGGGVEGTDYQLRWLARDTDANVWPRTTLILCAQTS